MIRKKGVNIEVKSCVVKVCKKVGALHSFPSLILIQNERWPELMWSQ